MVDIEELRPDKELLDGGVVIEEGWVDALRGSVTDDVVDGVKGGEVTGASTSWMTGVDCAGGSGDAFFSSGCDNLMGEGEAAGGCAGKTFLGACRVYTKRRRWRVSAWLKERAPRQLGL